MTAKRLKTSSCMAILVDVQDFFLQQLPAEDRERVTKATINAVRFLRYLQIPTLATLERPVTKKGGLPTGISSAVALEKSFFDLTKEQPIRDHIAELDKKQVILFGCETDVCVLQSCLGLLDLGYEVFVVEDLLFTSTKDGGRSAVQRMREAGAVLLSYKSLFHELFEAVDGSAHRRHLAETLGAFPSDISDE